MNWRAESHSAAIMPVDMEASWLTPGEFCLSVSIGMELYDVCEDIDQYTASLMLALDSIEKFSKGLTCTTTERQRQEHARLLSLVQDASPIYTSLAYGGFSSLYQRDTE